MSGLAHQSNEKVCITPAWHSRGYVPHYDGDRIQFITYRLADSLPKQKLEELEIALATMSDKEKEAERRQRIQAWLDAGMGCCALKHPAVARVVEETFRRFDGERYELRAWCIMPNHCHVMIKPFEPLARIVQSWKAYTGRWALAHNAGLMLGVSGKAFWMREYWDRFIRDENHYHHARDYIHNNQVKAGLCRVAEEWLWSSAYTGNRSF